jgi:hypothetical protein
MIDIVTKASIGREPGVGCNQLYFDGVGIKETSL